MPKSVVVIGTGGNSFDVVDAIFDCNEVSASAKYQLEGFLDDDPSKAGLSYRGVSVLGTLAHAKNITNSYFVFAIGSVNTRHRRESILESTGVSTEKFETIIHPRAWVSPTAKIGRGVIIFQHCVVTSNASIDDFVMILPNSIVSHDAKVGKYSCLAGGVTLSGGVVVGKHAYLGANCAVRDGRMVGDNALVGMGSCVIRDVSPGSTVAGNPSRILNRKQ